MNSTNLDCRENLLTWSTYEYMCCLKTICSPSHPCFSGSLTPCVYLLLLILKSYIFWHMFSAWAIDIFKCLSQSHHFMANRYVNSDRLYFLGLQNHCCGPGSIPGREIKLPQAMQCHQKELSPPPKIYSSAPQGSPTEKEHLFSCERPWQEGVLKQRAGVSKLFSVKGQGINILGLAIQSQAQLLSSVGETICK